MTEETSKKEIHYFCPKCGYEPSDAIRYQCRQNGESVEDMTEEEYNEEVLFYVYENHPEYCPAGWNPDEEE